MAVKFHQFEGVEFPIGGQSADEIKKLTKRYASHKKKAAAALKLYDEAASAYQADPNNGQARKLAKRLANQYRFSLRGRLVAVITQNKKLDRGRRRSLRQCFSLAKSLSAHKQSDEIVRVRFKPKASGGQRPIQEFGLRHRSAQQLAKSIIECRMNPRDWQYTHKGVPKAIRFLKDLEPGAETWAAKLDIKDFYGHFLEADLKKLLWEVPQSVVKATLLSKENVLMDYKGVPLAGSYLQDAHRGVAQGSIVSPLLGALAVSNISWNPDEKIGCANYADDFLLVANSKSDLDDAVHAFDLAVQAGLPGGNFHLKPPILSQFGHGVAFLGHYLFVARDGLKVDPGGPAITRLAERLDELRVKTRLAIVSHKEHPSDATRHKMLGQLASILYYVNGWCSSFAECEKQALIVYYSESMDVLYELVAEAGVTMEEVELAAPAPTGIHGTSSELDEAFNANIHA